MKFTLFVMAVIKSSPYNSCGKASLPAPPTPPAPTPGCCHALTRARNGLALLYLDTLHFQPIGASCQVSEVIGMVVAIADYDDLRY